MHVSNHLKKYINKHSLGYEGFEEIKWQYAFKWAIEYYLNEQLIKKIPKVKCNQELFKTRCLASVYEIYKRMHQ